MSGWAALLWLLAGLAVVGLVDLLIVVRGLAVERADEQSPRVDDRTASPRRRFS